MKYVFKMNFEYEYIDCNKCDIFAVEEVYDYPIDGDYNNLPQSQIGIINQVVEIVSDSFSDAVNYARVDFLIMLFMWRPLENIRLKPVNVDRVIKVLVDNKWVYVDDVCADDLEQKMSA